MDQLSAMSEEDMFVETQAHEQTELGSDDMYISLVQAIAVKKCRIIQKKEKIKLALQTLKKLDTDLEVSRKESERIKNEREEISNQLNLKALNLKGAEDYRASLETVLCNLKGKVSNLEKETIEKRNKFHAAIENAKAKWESYKETYEGFPLAKKRKELIIELKKTDIELKKTKFDIEDLKVKKKLKAEIAEKQYRLSCVKLARAFLTRKVKIAELNAVSVRISELRKRLEDNEVGSIEENRTIAAKPVTSSLPSQGKQRATKSNFLQFKLPQFPLSPPQLDIENEPPNTRLNSWKNLFSSVNLLNISRKFQTNQGGEPKIPDKFSEQSTQQVSRTLPNPYQKTSNSEIDQINVRNIHSKSLSNESKQMPTKRKSSSESNVLTENQINQEPPNKVRFSYSVLGGNAPVKDNANMQLIGNDGRATSENVQKADEKLPNKSNLKINKTEIIKSYKYPSSSFSIDPMAMTKKMPLSHTLTSVSTLRLSANQQKSYKPRMNTTASKVLIGTNNIQKEQQIHQTPVNQDAVDLFADGDNENRLDNLTCGLPSQEKQRELVAVQSQYFSNIPKQSTQSLNLEKQISQEEVYHTPYSPPVHINLGSGPDVTSNVPSPIPEGLEEVYHTPYSPPDHINLGSVPDVTINAPSPISEGLGYFGFGEKTSSEKQLFNQPSRSTPEGNKSPEAQFGFNFMSNPTEKSSFFSLF